MSSLDLLAAMGSAASMISLADTMAKAQPRAPYMEYRNQRFDGGFAGPIMAGIGNIAKAIPVIRRAARKEVHPSEIAAFEQLPGTAIAALTKKAVEAEQRAATAYSEMDGVDRVKVMRITDTLRADMCTILQAIYDLNGGELPSAVRPKWKQFNCAA